MTAPKAPVAVRILRRLIVPALVSGVLSNVAMYAMLGAEGPLEDWKSMAMMAAISLAGILTGGVLALRLADRVRLPAPLRIALLAAAAVATGGALAFAIASLIVDEERLGYVQYGLAAGAVGGLVWICLNLDLAVRPGNRSPS